MRDTDLLLGKRVPFVGRAQDVAAIEKVVAEAIAEDARAVVVVGAAGMGKSRLARELRARWKTTHPSLRVWFGQGNARSYQSPFGVLGPMLRRAMGIRDGQSELEHRRALTAFFDDLGARPAQRHLDLVAELAAIETTSPTESVREARADPRLLGDMMAGAWPELVRAVLRRGPLAIVVDDLHWCDPPSIAYLDAALRHAEDMPLVVVGFARASIDARFPTLFEEHRITRRELRAMDRAASCELVQHVLDDAAQAEIEGIVESARGNAFFLEEIVRAFAARGKKREPSESPAEMVSRRVRALQSDERRVLRAASIFGEHFWIGAVAGLLDDIPASKLAAILDTLVRAELIGEAVESRFPNERQMMFRSALVRDAAYDSLPEDHRAFGHHHAAQWLTRMGETDSILLAEHWARGAVPDRAREELTRSAQRAFAGHDFESACELVERAMTFARAPDQRAVLHAMSAEAHRWLGNFSAAAESAHQAAIASEPGSALWLGAVEELLISLGRLGRFDDASAWLERVRPTTPTPETASQLVATACAGARMLFQRGSYREADALLAEIRAHTIVHRNTMSLRALAESARLRGARARHRGEIAEDYAGYGEALKLLERLGDERNACNARVSFAFSLIELGAFEQAEIELLRAHGDAARMGMTTVENRARQNLALIAAVRGDLDEARELARDVIETSLAENNPRFEGWTRIYASQFAYAAGEFAIACEEADRAVSNTVGSPPARAGALAARARARLAQGDTKGAARDASEAKSAMVAHGGIEEFEMLVRLALVEALLAEGDREGARGELTEAKERLLRLAADMEDDELERRFLERVPLNARLLSMTIPP